MASQVIDAALPIALAFLLAGVVKGIAGMGLPSVAVGTLALVIGLQPALALLLVPSFVTNVWQAVVGGNLLAIVRRIWLLLLIVSAATWLGVELLARLDAKPLKIVLGLTLMAYATMGLTRFVLPHPGRHERWLPLPIGIVHGLVAGMTGSFVAAVPYMQAFGWGKALLVQGMGILFTVNTVALAVAMADHRIVTPELGLASAAATVPALVGMYLGQLVRGRLSEARFKLVLYWALMLLGGYILIRAVVG